MKNAKGLILIELIMTIVLIGIIATFIGFFIYSGINGYLRAKDITTGALDAQRALDRISLELRDITDITGTPNSSTVTYKSAVLTLTGTRTLKYAGNTIFINIAATDRELLEDVSSFNLSYTYLNLDDDTDTPPVDEVANIEVTFSLEDIGKNFRTNIFPRNLVKKTW